MTTPEGIRIRKTMWYGKQKTNQRQAMSNKIVDAINGKSQQQCNNKVATIIETKVSTINEITISQQFNETQGLNK